VSLSEQVRGKGAEGEREREREERKTELVLEFAKARRKSWIPTRTRRRMNGIHEGVLNRISAICSLMKLIERSISFHSETTSDSYDIFLFFLC